MSPVIYLLTLHFMGTFLFILYRSQPLCMANGSTTVDYKMAEIDVWLEQVAREFWVAEGEKLPCIHERLLKMYHEAMVDVS
jgi:hypothetical protein